MTEFRLDRILHEHEISQLKDLLVPKLKDDYPNFEKWLEKAQEEIANGSRIAIGIWREKLIATSIVKVTASKTAELKSFFVDSNFRNQGYGDSLYKETELQCRKAGVKKIIVDTYINNIFMVEFLISKGFIIIGKEDLYGNERESYILLKSIYPDYFGDPYDWEELGEWYICVNFNAIKIKDHPKVDERRFDRHMQINSGGFNFDILVEIKDQKVDQDDVEILHKKCSESNFHLSIFVAREFSERAKKYAERHGVINCSNEDIEKILGYKPQQFREGPIGGMVVAIKPEYLKRILGEENPTYYVKGGPKGKYLRKGQKLFFYATDPEKKLSAIGEIDSIEIDSPNEIWNLIEKETIFSEAEYFRFASIKQKILAIKLKKVWEISPINDEELKSLIPKKDRVGSYIDMKTIDKILKSV